MKTQKQLETELAEKNAQLTLNAALKDERKTSNESYSYKWVENLFAKPLITLIVTAVFGALIYLVIKK